MSGLFYGFTLVKCLEYIGRLQTDLYAGCHIGKVCVKPAGLLIIVSGSDLCIIFYSGVCLSCDQAQFGMHFVSVQAVNHAASGLFQSSGPFDVIFLVKAGFQLDHDKNFFAVFSSFDQCLHDFTLTCQTIQGHLDRNDGFVVCGLMKHAKEWFHAFKWIRKQFVFFFDLRKDRFLQIKLR